jgi:hypothetical protein
MKSRTFALLFVCSTAQRAPIRRSSAARGWTSVSILVVGILAIALVTGLAYGYLRSRRYAVAPAATPESPAQLQPLPLALNGIMSGVALPFADQGVDSAPPLANVVIERVVPITALNGTVVELWKQRPAGTVIDVHHLEQAHVMAANELPFGKLVAVLDGLYAAKGRSSEAQQEMPVFNVTIKVTIAESAHQYAAGVLRSQDEERR